MPVKVGFFAWEASWSKVLTLDQLKKRGRSLADRWYLCGKGEETVGHLLIHCSKAKILWDLLLAIFGISWVFPLCEGDLSFLTRFFCGKALQEVLDRPSLHFLGFMVGKKQTCF